VQLWGTKLELWRELVNLARVIISFQLLSAGWSYFAIFGQIRNRSLSNQANGVETVIRPDEQLIQTESLWSLAVAIFVLLVVNETWHRLETTNQFLPREPKLVP
jgi:hypothetical protein